VTDAEERARAAKFALLGIVPKYVPDRERPVVPNVVVLTWAACVAPGPLAIALCGHAWPALAVLTLGLVAAHWLLPRGI
jgi:hypothetical protein